MKKKRWLISGIALLAIALLATLLFAGCRKKNAVDEPPTEQGSGEIVVVEHGERVNVDLAGYALSYTAGGSGAFREKMSLLGTRLEALTGVATTAGPSADTRVIEVKTDAADADIEGHGFVIRRSGEKISIVGTTALITQMGVDYFMNHYLTGAVISLPEKAISDQYEMIKIESSTEDRYYVVYDADIDIRSDMEDENLGDTDAYYGKSSETGYDYAYHVAKEFIARFPTALARADVKEVKEKELLIGATNRPETAQALSYLRGHEYGIMVINDRIVVTGYSVVALHKAAPLFFDYLSDARDVNGDILFPRNLRMIGEVSDRWLTDITFPQGLPLAYTADDGDGVFQYLYTGSEAVNHDAFSAYVNTLVGEGYTILTQSSAEGSCFVTLTDATRAKMIHVAYDAYAHAKDNAAGKAWKYSDPAIRVTTAFTNSVATHYNDVKPSGYEAGKEYKTYESGWREVYYYNPAFTLAQYRDTLIQKGFAVQFTDNVENVIVMRNPTTGERVTARVANDKEYVKNETTYVNAIAVRYLAPGLVELPDAELLSANQSYTKVTDTKIVPIDLSAVKEVGVTPSYGTGYVMQLEDGRFVIIDGGASDSGSTKESAYAQVKNCWSILSSLYTQTFGREPSPEHPVEIAAWIITHAHGDHMYMFWDFVDRYGGGAGPNTIGAYATLEYLIANSPDFTMMYNTGEPNMNLPREMAKFMRYYKDGFTFIKAQTGQHYYLANLDIETLFTPGDLYPQRIVTYNDSSTIQRLHFRSTANEKGARTLDHYASDAVSTTFLSTGDAYRWGGRWICAMYGSYLKTDMVSVSHHGGPGFTAAVYDMIAPRTLLWSMSAGTVHSGFTTGSSWYAEVNRHFYYELESVEYIFIADVYHVMITIDESGARYDAIRDAVTGETISYHVTSKKMTEAQKAQMRDEKPIAIHKT